MHGIISHSFQEFRSGLTAGFWLRAQEIAGKTQAWVGLADPLPWCSLTGQQAPTGSLQGASAPCPMNLSKGLCLSSPYGDRLPEWVAPESKVEASEPQWLRFRSPLSIVTPSIG